MTFKGLARFASVLFGLVVVVTVITTWSLVSQSYQRTVDSVDEINKLTNRISVEERNVGVAQARIDQLSSLPNVLAKRCESQLLDPDIKVPRSCQDLENLPSRISSATSNLASAEVAQLELEAERELLRAEVEAEKALQQVIISNAIGAGLAGIALWAAFTLALLWRKESTGWKE